MSNSWVKDTLAARGYTQRDLAKAWAISEGGVSRWLAGTEQQDLPFSRAVKLGAMLDMPLDELAARMGLRGKRRDLPPPSLPLTGVPQVGTIAMSPGPSGEMRVLLHLDVPVKVAAEVVALLNTTPPPTRQPDSDRPPKQ